MDKFESIEEKVIYEKLKITSQPIVAHDRQAVDNSMNMHAYIDELHSLIGSLNHTRENYAFRNISSHRKVIGNVIVFLKRAIRKCLKWYVEPICFQQTAFNNATTSSIGRITELATYFADEAQKNKAELINLHDKVAIITDYEARIKHNELIIEELQQEMNNRSKEILLLEQNIEQKNIVLNHANEEIKDLKTFTTSLENEIVEKNKMIYHYEYNQKYLHEKQKELENKIVEDEERVRMLEKVQDQMIQKYNAIDNYFSKLNSLELDIFQEKYNPWNKMTTSQSGEDSICFYILMVLGIAIENCTYLDLGANHAKDLSNTYLLYQHGAKGVLVEANPALIAELKFYRHRDIILNNCVVPLISCDNIAFYILNGDGLSTTNLESAQEAIRLNNSLEIIETVEVETITINEVIEKYLGVAPTLLNLDVEGNELELLQSIDFIKYRPLIIITEMINYKPHLVVGEKNQEILEFMQTNEYIEYAFTGINSIFVDKKQIQGVLS